MARPKKLVRKPKNTARKPDATHRTVQLGRLESRPDCIDAKRAILKAMAAGEIEEKLGNAIMRGIASGGLFEMMSDTKVEEFEARLAAIESMYRKYGPELPDEPPSPPMPGPGSTTVQ
jgi:hypothetical protein